MPGLVKPNTRQPHNLVDGSPFTRSRWRGHSKRLFQGQAFIAIVIHKQDLDGKLSPGFSCSRLNRSHKKHLGQPEGQRWRINLTEDAENIQFALS